MPYLIKDTCTGCGACLPECPTQAIHLSQLEKNRYLIDTDACDDHALCVAVCPVDAIIPMPKLTPEKIRP